MDPINTKKREIFKIPHFGVSLRLCRFFSDIIQLINTNCGIHTQIFHFVSLLPLLREAVLVLPSHLLL